MADIESLLKEKRVFKPAPAFAKRAEGSKGAGAWRANKAAISGEGEPGDTRVLTYRELHREVCRFANALKALGVEKGDRVALYMPMIPELAIALLACTRLGAPHRAVF